MELQTQATNDLPWLDDFRVHLVGLLPWARWPERGARLWQVFRLLFRANGVSHAEALAVAESFAHGFTPGMQMALDVHPLPGRLTAAAIRSRAGRPT